MSHEASVTITNPGTGNVVAVNIDKLKPGGAKKVVWTVDTVGWEFATNGIVIINNNNAQFSDPQRYGNNQKFSWDDANTDRLTYKYNINVQPAGQPTLGASLDPMIENGNISP